MYAKRLLTIAVAAMLVIGGAAAVGAAVPADASNDGSPGADSADAAPGPADGLPAAAPDFVSGVLETIGSFLDGNGNHLGSALSDFPGSGTAADSVHSGSNAL